MMNKHLARHIAFDTVQYAYRRTNWPVKVPPLLGRAEHSARQICQVNYVPWKSRLV
jgi:hypothetical protein